MKQTKRQRAQCVTPCELMAGTKQQCEIWRRLISSRVMVHITDLLLAETGTMICDEAPVLFDKTA